MSSQKGNALRQRPQKHCNVRGFRNNANDKSPRVKAMNGINLKEWDLCKRCIEIIQWKITYKKYKPLTCPKKCIKCSQKSVKRAYCTVCTKCSQALKICEKCAKNEFEGDAQEKDATLVTGTTNIKKVDKKSKHSKEEEDDDDKVDDEECDDDFDSSKDDNLNDDDESDVDDGFIESFTKISN